MEQEMQTRRSETRLLRCGKYRLPLGKKTLLMGIINMTPDSFSHDGLLGDLPAAVARAKTLVAEGADLLDIGGESARAGFPPRRSEEEIARILPLIRALREEVEVPLSVDTYKSQVAEAALEAGASMINDISGLRVDPKLAEVAARYRAALVVMHIRGRPKERQIAPRYQALLPEICAFLQESIQMALRAGVLPDQIVVDPGIDFGKTTAQSLEVLKRLAELKNLGFPLLLAPSRKTVIGEVLQVPVEDRLEGTAAVVAYGVTQGVDILRVHEVKAMRRVVRMVEAILQGEEYGRSGQGG
ncbi:MAG: dihydropteroate synthase [Nitrospinota bacterium]|nr:MAG: dihydropteroate synthase [Nitrospinota bacterium]